MNIYKSLWLTTSIISGLGTAAVGYMAIKSGIFKTTETSKQSGTNASAEAMGLCLNMILSYVQLGFCSAFIVTLFFSSTVFAYSTYKVISN